MSLTINDLLISISLPKRYFDNNFTIAEKFEEESAKFLNLLDSCVGDEFSGKRKKDLLLQALADIRTMAKSIIEMILQIYTFYEAADLGSAQKKFDKLIQTLDADLFISSVDDWVPIEYNGRKHWTHIRMTPGHRLYRIRPAQRESKEIEQDYDQLFHISHLKRSHSNNERFSLSGFPSLYLSTMLPLAWQECDYPQSYYYSEYQYEPLDVDERIIAEELKLITLYSPWELLAWGIGLQHSHFEFWLNVISRYLKTYPLILACSFVNQSGNTPFKQEYIIPQMLMQWIQRNSDKIDGISYFTCTDTSSFLSHWCAYNIAIPATAPFDEKKYSIKLRNQFCWTKPRFYRLPLVGQNKNVADRQFIYDFLNDVHIASSIAHLPTRLNTSLNNMLTVAGCLMSLLDSASSMDMQLALHTLELLSKACNQSGIQETEGLLADAKSEIGGSPLAENFDLVERQFKNLAGRFYGTTSSGLCIYTLIEKYKWTSWNDHPPRSQALILYREYSQIEKLVEWFHNNHILHSTHKLKPDDKCLNLLREIAEESKAFAAYLGDVCPDDDEQIKARIDEIKAPIIVKQNDCSPYYETPLIEFDEAALKHLFVD